MVESGFNKVASIEPAPFEVKPSFEPVKSGDIVQLTKIVEHNGKACYTDGRLYEVDTGIQRSPVQR